jgi:predicted pyridoxine 5'-phosphate oxidase superfamily flavin-nucleotide-binding protein
MPATSLLRGFALLALLPLAACGTAPTGGNPGPDPMTPAPANAPAVADGETFTLRPQQAVTLADQATLRLLEVTNDSRCRPGHQCIWAGDAELVLQWQPATGAGETFSLHTTKGDKTHAIGERRVDLLSLSFDEPPVASLRVDRGD